MTSSDTVKMLKLKSSGGEIFEVEEAVALLSETIKPLLEDCTDDDPIPLPNVQSDILSLVVEYCKVHVKYEGENSAVKSAGEKSAVKSDGEKSVVKSDGKKSAVKPDGEKAAAKSEGVKSAKEKLKAFDEEFVNVDQHTLFNLILAANYLNIKSLLDLTCQAVADSIKDYTPEQVRTFFNITSDFTPKEEEELRKENAWAFE